MLLPSYHRTLVHIGLGPSHTALAYVRRREAPPQLGQCPQKRDVGEGVVVVIVYVRRAIDLLRAFSPTSNDDVFFASSDRPTRNLSDALVIVAVISVAGAPRVISGGGCRRRLNRTIPASPAAVSSSPENYCRRREDRQQRRGIRMMPPPTPVEAVRVVRMVPFPPRRVWGGGDAADAPPPLPTGDLSVGSMGGVGRGDVVVEAEAEAP